jgi:hypothetical protein
MKVVHLLKHNGGWRGDRSRAGDAEIVGLDGNDDGKQSEDDDESDKYFGDHGSVRVRLCSI